jgi:hypothetical protein
MHMSINTKGHNVLTRVSELINPQNNYWDEQLVYQTFWTIDARRVMKMPLPNHGMDDFASWKLTKTSTCQ